MYELFSVSKIFFNVSQVFESAGKRLIDFSKPLERPLVGVNDPPTTHHSRLLSVGSNRCSYT